MGALGALGALGVLGGWCEQRQLRELRRLRESGGLRDQGDHSSPGEQRSRGGHGKPRGGDGKVEQGVEGAQEHEDTLPESTPEPNLPNRVTGVKFVEDRRFVAWKTWMEAVRPFSSSWKEKRVGLNAHEEKLE